MAVDVAQSPLPDSRPLHRLIRHTRRLLRCSWVAIGLGLTLGLFLTALVLTTLVDLVVPIWPTASVEIPYWPGKTLVVPHLAAGLRVLSLVLVLVPAGWAFLAGVVRPLFRRLRPEQVARRIEEHLPGIHNRLVSCIDLENARRGRRTGGSPASMSPVFYRRLLTEALERIKSFRPRRVLDFLSLRRSGLFAVGSLTAFAVLWLLFAAGLPTALARVFFPLRDLPRHSDVAYAVTPAPDNDDMQRLRDEIITFTAEVTAGHPDKLWLQVYGSKGSNPPPFDLAPDKNDSKKWTCSIDGPSLGAGFQDGFRYRVLGGGTWSPEYQITLLERPVVTGVKTYVHYPEYMKLPGRRETAPDAKEVVGPEGGQVEVVVEARGQVAEGDIQLLKPGRKPIPTREQVERVWFDGQLPKGVLPGGSWDWQEEGPRTVHTEPAAAGTHGHWFQDDQAGPAVQAGTALFAYVYVVPGKEPETILLQWTDGTGWEHGAYWGADRIREGKAGTASKQAMGPLPASGKWVRLEVPAAAVGLAGKTVRGMAFKLHGGQCLWHTAGTVQVEKDAYVTDTARPFPMTQAGDGSWVGRFPLTGTGHFRVAIRNHRGHANTEMEETRFVAVPDKPPLVELQKPGADSTLSKPNVVPLTIAAFDDYGLAEVNLLVRPTETAHYEKIALQRFEKPVGDKNLVAYLKDAAKLTPGGQLRYVIEAVDTKGQATRTREYTVRISDDANAADRQLAEFEKNQDQFRDRLAQLIAEQKKVQTALEKASTRYADLTAKIEALQNEALKGNVPPKTDPKTGQKEPDLTSKLDPEMAKKLAELQKELAALGKEEDRNTKVAEQLNTDLARAAEQAGQLQMLPRPIAEQMQMTQRAFEQAALRGLRDLLGQMNQGADPKQGPPDLKGLNQKGERVGKELQSIKDRLDALAKARKGLRDDLAEVLKELQREMLNQTGGLTERELKELRDYLAKLREDLKILQQRQDDIAKNTAEGNDLKANEAKQTALDQDLEKLLDEAKKLLAARKKRRPMDDRPEFPDAPYTPDGTEAKVPPKENDTTDPLPGQKNKPTDPMGKNAGEKDKKDDEKEPLFMPNLGGPKPVPDKRFDKKQRPVQPKPGDKPQNPNDPDARRNDLQDKQDQNQRDLDSALKSLGSDQKSLDQMLDALKQAMQGNQKGQQGQKGQEGQPGEESAMQQLMQMLQSAQMRQAMAMAARMRQPGQRGQPGQPSPPQPGQGQPNLQGGPTGNAPLDGELAKLDPATRAVILKLQPRVREELLQGMREQGPEGYAAFIQDYFKRLTEMKGPGK